MMLLNMNVSKKHFLCLIVMVWGCGAMTQGLGTFDKLLRYEFESADSLQIELLSAQQEYLNKDKGFRFQSSMGSNEFGDLEDGNIFRVKAGFEWNLMNEGYRDRKLGVKVLEIEKEIFKLENEGKSFDNNYAHIYNYIIYCFNSEKLRYLEEKSYLLNILIKRYEALYHAHGADFQDLLVLYEKMEEVKILTYACKMYNKGFEDPKWVAVPRIVPNYLPILEIDTDLLDISSKPDSSLEALKNLKTEKQKLEDKMDNPTRISLYNNVYWRPLVTSTNNTIISNNAGIRFSTRLGNRKNEKETMAKLEEKIDKQKYEINQFNVQKELINTLLEYHSKLRTYSRYAYQLKSLEEEKRLDKAVKLVNHRTPQSDLKGLKIELRRLDVLYEMLEIKQQMYLNLLKIYKNAGISSILQITKEKNLFENSQKIKGERLLLIDDVDYNINQFTFIKEYLKENEFTHVIIPKNLTHLSELQKLLESEGIRVYPELQSIANLKIIEVPIKKFNDRVSMEYWINDNLAKNTLYLITDLKKLLEIDSFSLQK